MQFTLVIWLLGGFLPR